MENLIKTVQLKRKLAEIEQNNRALDYKINKELSEIDLTTLDKASSLRVQLDNLIYNTEDTHNFSLYLFKLRLKRDNEDNFSIHDIDESEMDLSSVRVLEIVETFSATPKVCKEVANSEDFRANLLTKAYKFKEKTVVPYILTPYGVAIDLKYKQVGAHTQSLIESLSNVIFPINNLYEKMDAKFSFLELSEPTCEIKAYNFNEYVRLLKEVAHKGNCNQIKKETASRDDILNLISLGEHLCPNELLADYAERKRAKDNTLAI